jgi:ribonuclease BN (tRNA processing enzyme)
MMRSIALLAVLVALCSASHAANAPSGVARSAFLTLGTMAGPLASARRSQPANLLLAGDQAILIDAGDGAAGQLAKVGVPLAEVHSLFLSHLHLDHTGGLFAILGMRFQAAMPGSLTIYGPPGTRRMVDGLLAAMQPAAEAGAGIPGQPSRDPHAGIRVEEIVDGSTVELGDVRVGAVRNTHYSFPVGSPEAARYQSLSLRFDLPDRSVVYTGDTGPSAAVERLAHGVDLLVSEVIDPDAALADVRKSVPNLPPAILALIREHFLEQHLSAEAAGQLARNAGGKSLVLTHVALGDRPEEPTRAAAARAFGGPVRVAHDLGRF